MEKPGPFAWLEFDESGTISPDSLQGFAAMIAAAEVSELVVMAHGWKNNKADATKLYGTLWTNACTHIPEGRATTIAVAGVLWPAKAYATDFDTAAMVDANAGGTVLSVEDGSAVSDLSEADFQVELAAFRAFFGTDAASTVEAARDASTVVTNDTAKRLVDEGAELVGIGHTWDPELSQNAAPIAAARKSDDLAQALISSLVVPPELKMKNDVGAAQGVGEDIAGLLQGPRAAVARFLNQLTFFEMKKRAGLVGVSLAQNVLGEIKRKKKLTLHLVGHSFGARLVTATANALGPIDAVDFFSLTLLQGAFSHNALGKNLEGVDGAFVKAVGKPTGPFVITHTHNDLACTLAYALASRLSRDTTQSIGDANDDYGAMGANGPQRLRPGQAQSDDQTGSFTFEKGTINPVLADTFILKTADTDAHNNVTNPECGRMLAAALAGSV